jgi:hypothetical protein
MKGFDTGTFGIDEALVPNVRHCRVLKASPLPLGKVDIVPGLNRDLRTIPRIVER